MTPLPHGFTRESFDVLASTQALARQRVESGSARNERGVIVAARQTGGVGRFSKPWASPAGGLWCTFLWPPGNVAPAPPANDPASPLHGLGLRIGVACLSVIRRTLAHHGKHKNVALKWPNDILIDGKKVLGVLTEVVSGPARPAGNRSTFILVGVGINVNLSTSDLPPEVAPLATTLREHLGEDTHLERVLHDLAQHLGDALLQHGVPAQTLALARQSLAGVGEQVDIRPSIDAPATLAGTLIGLRNDGEAIIRTPDGRDVAAPGGVLVLTQ